METGRSWYESAIRSQRVKDAVERNARAGKRTGGGSRPFGYKINRHDLGEGGKRRYRIIGEEIEPAEAEAIKEAAARVLRGESIRSIAFNFNDRGIKPVAGGRWAGSTLRRMLVSPRIAGLREHNGEVVSGYDLTCRSGYDLTCRSRQGDHGMGSPPATRVRRSLSR
jgi:hypothetical protein